MQILEVGVPIFAAKLVDGVGCLPRLARARHRPCRQQRRSEGGDRPADRLGKLATRDRILLLLDRAHPEDEPRDAIVLVDLQNAFGKLDPFISLAIGKHRQEGAAEQFVVTGIGAQRGAVIGRRGGDVALTARVSSGEHPAGSHRYAAVSVLDAKMRMWFWAVCLLAFELLLPPTRFSARLVSASWLYGALGSSSSPAIGLSSLPWLCLRLIQV